MPTTDQDRVVVALDEAECHALLQAGRIGRLGFTRYALPAIHPVTYCVRNSEVVIPALPHSEYLPGTRNAVVVFEIDAYDEADRTGWSVSLLGRSYQIHDPAEVTACDALPWPHPTTAPGRCYVAVRVGPLHGWRTVPHLVA
ncbi:Pyridoxamine 5'-phosphate oxidase [Geodermatophilus obscurus]|uniref:Pyridoxamine 5'-phosphate oxidase n=1 Tax=Geodermatophilus obscurus TaxID=1861 RepID=A0A1M7UZH1_9ACTN|nr:pyridoxamine 5'-phosphate oxidase family protein [Geodermatophilus obscurus]SHN88431.1 Pyridoxamine 5'-phosphate oxidase [Geodermatophilus obscurus]